jgi:hypothetical protein
MSSNGKTAIIEHHRSVQWAETEYANLYTLLGANQETVRREMVDGFSDQKELFMDYCKMLKYHEQLDPVQAARRGV